jgi:hypothetical protein
MNLVENGYDDTTGEIATTQEEFNLMYDSIELELSTKIDNTNGLVKSIKSETEMIDNEIKRLQELKKRREQTMKWLTDRVDYVLKFQFTNDDGVLDVGGLKEAVKNLNKQLLHSQLSYRKSESVEIIDEDAIPKKYKRVEIKESPDKTKLKEYLSTLPKRECNYAKMKDNLNLSIK